MLHDSTKDVPDGTHVHYAIRLANIAAHSRSLCRNDSTSPDPHVRRIARAERASIEWQATRLGLDMTRFETVRNS